MPFTDLSRVTTAIKALVKKNLETRFAGEVPPFDVSAASPEAHADATTAIVSIHLFHLMEEGHRKNAAPPFGGSAVPVRLIPMGLSLFYVITVLSTAATDSDVDSLTQQKLLGFTAKTFHDFPVL